MISLLGTGKSLTFFTAYIVHVLFNLMKYSEITSAPDKPVNFVKDVRIRCCYITVYSTTAASPKYACDQQTLVNKCNIHRKKKVREFPVPRRDVTTKLSLGGNNDVITELFLPRGSLVSYIPAGDGKLMNLFLRCIMF